MNLPPKPGLGRIADKLEGGLKASAKPASIQATKARVEKAIGNIRGNHPLKNNPLLQDYLELLMSETEEGIQLKNQLISRARDEFERRKGQAAALAEILRPFTSKEIERKFWEEVLRPVATRRINSSMACLEKLKPFLQPQSKTPILNWLETVFGPLTFGVGGGAEGGAGFGLEGAMCLALRRNNPVAVTQAITVAMGAYAEGAASIQGSVAGGFPTAADSLTMDISVSAASGVSGEIVVSLAPTFHKPTLSTVRAKDGGDLKRDFTSQKILGGDVYRGEVVDYAFSGLAVSLGEGAGLGASIGFTYTSAFLLSK